MEFQQKIIETSCVGFYMCCQTTFMRMAVYRTMIIIIRMDHDTAAAAVAIAMAYI